MLKDYVRAIEAAGLDLHSVSVMTGGKLAAEHCWLGDRDTRHILHSATKGVAVLAVGLAIEEGKLSLDDRVADLFPELVPEEHSPYLEELRVRHLLNMTSGHGQAFMGALQRSEIEDPFWARYYMKQPLVRRPGERFLYDSANSYLLGYAIVRRTGQDLEEYLRPRVLEPLGIKDAPWQKDPMGYAMGCAGLYLNPAEMLKIGELYLNKGSWRGTQLVPSSWIEECSKKQSDNSHHSVPYYKALRSGYGYQLWLCENGAFRADGIKAQLIIVWPEKDTVIVTTGGVSVERCEAQIVMDLAWEHLDPERL